VCRAFDEAYAQRYGDASPGEAVEAVTWKVAAVGARPRRALPRIARRGSLDSALRGPRPVYFPEKGGCGARVDDHGSLLVEISGAG
jgi:hypothetical protein